MHSRETRKALKRWVPVLLAALTGSGGVLQATQGARVDKGKCKDSSAHLPGFHKSDGDHLNVLCSL